jgi:pentatricopeptide repeat protein
MKIHAGFGGFQFWLGRIYTAVGEYDNAAQFFQTAWNLVPLLDVKSHWIHCLGRMGRTESAEALLSELEQHRKIRYVPPHGLALAHLGLGRVEIAIDWLERGLEEHDVWLPLLLNLDPWLDEIRRHPRVRHLRQLLRQP